jgi:hypothetical protein
MMNSSCFHRWRVVGKWVRLPQIKTVSPRGPVVKTNRIAGSSILSWHFRNNFLLQSCEYCIFDLKRFEAPRPANNLTSCYYRLVAASSTCTAAVSWWSMHGFHLNNRRLHKRYRQHPPGAMLMADQARTRTSATSSCYVLLHSDCLLESSH